MIRSSAIHIAYRILAAFFIVMGTKTSIVENLVIYQPNLVMSLSIKFKLVFRPSLAKLLSSSFVNDPSAGSPTETLLRLLLPLGDKVYLFFRKTV